MNMHMMHMLLVLITELATPILVFSDFKERLMAAYAALVSLMHIVDQIQNHPRPPISLDKKQVQSLTENVTFLQDFLEGYSNGGSEGADVLEGRIANAAYAAEDIIESHIADQILGGSTSTHHGKQMSGSTEFYQGLHKVIQDMDFIKRDVSTDVKEKTQIHDQLHKISISAGSSRFPPTGQNTMVGLDDVKIEIMDKLTGQQSNRQIIPIVGMGGIGKTTLTRNIYVNPLIKHHFDILAWATISQDYNAKEILIQVLLCLKTIGSNESLSQMSEDKLGEILYKSLSGRRYLIVMDDIWSIEAWDKVKFFFPDNNNGSRIIITTRLSNLAFELTGSYGFKMNFLDEDKSWNLLCNNVDCPIELEDIGKKIAKNCKGLPLSIVVIGGLLAKSKRGREYWQHIAENLNSIVKLEDNERCSKVLQMSYNQLPVHLKPCFLYMGMYPEDCEIDVPNLMKLWVAEGFLKPIGGKILEVVAEEYFNDLVDRNLVLVSLRKYSGKIKYCKIHDLLMDLCISEAQKHKFLYVTRLQHNLNNIPQDISTQLRIVVHEGTTPEVIDALPSASLARSFTYKSYCFLGLFDRRLLRVWNGKGSNSLHSLESSCFLVNCRYIDCLHISKPGPRSSPSPICLFWNLQTLVVTYFSWAAAASEIWKMSQLRHMRFYLLHLPDPPKGDNFVLGNLQTLSVVRDFKCDEEAVKRIPNIKKLRLYYERIKEWTSCSLNNLGRLHKLESLICSFSPGNTPSRSYLVQNLIFPHSLRKLTLFRTRLWCDDITTMLGSLPLLQVLKLNESSFIGSEWETVEGQFCSLKLLQISNCSDLEYWRTESAHFPRLEHLVLRGLDKLKEIPLDIGEIPTLQSIQLNFCSDSAIFSARNIFEEQEELGNVGLQVRVVHSRKDTSVKSLASPNFLVDLR